MLRDVIENEAEDFNMKSAQSFMADQLTRNFPKYQRN